MSDTTTSTIEQPPQMGQEIPQPEWHPPGSSDGGTPQAPSAPAQPSPPQEGAEQQQRQQTPETQQPTDDRGEIDKLAADLGFDPSDLAGYNTVDEARAAIRGYLDNVSRMAGTPQPAPTPPPAQPLQQSQQHALPPQQQQTGQQLWQLNAQEFGLEDDSPEFKAIQAYDQRMQQVIGSLAGHVQAAQQQQAETARTTLRNEINGAVDSFGGQEFGSGGNISRFQEMNRERLFRVAGDIAGGYRASGREVPGTRQLLALAKFQYDQERGIVSAPQPNGGQPQPTPPLTGRSPASAGNPPTKPGGMIRPWSQDPQIRSQLGL